MFVRVRREQSPRYSHYLGFFFSHQKLNLDYVCGNIA